MMMVILMLPGVRTHANGGLGNPHIIVNWNSTGGIFTSLAAYHLYIR